MEKTCQQRRNNTIPGLDDKVDIFHSCQKCAEYW
jgi:hypothetical protein